MSRRIINEAGEVNQRALVEAISSNDVKNVGLALVRLPQETIEALLGENLKGTIADFMTPMHCCHSSEMLRVLIGEKGARIGLLNSKNGLGKTYVEFAIRSARLDLVQYIESLGVGADWRSDKGENILHLAAEAKDPEVLNYLFQKYPSLMLVPDASGSLPIGQIFSNTQLEIISYALSDDERRKAVFDFRFRTNMGNIIHEMVTLNVDFRIANLGKMVNISELREVRTKLENFGKTIGCLSCHFPELVLHKNAEGRTPFQDAWLAREFDLCLVMICGNPVALAAETSLSEKEKIIFYQKIITQDPTMVRTIATTESLLCAFDSGFFDFAEVLFQSIKKDRDKKFIKEKLIPRLLPKFLEAIESDETDLALKIASICPQIIDIKIEEDAKENFRNNTPIARAHKLRRYAIVEGFQKILEEKGMLEPVPVAHRAEITEFREKLAQGLSDGLKRQKNLIS